MLNHSDTKIQTDGFFFNKIKLWSNVVRGRGAGGGGGEGGGAVIATPHTGYLMYGRHHVHMSSISFRSHKYP